MYESAGQLKPGLAELVPESARVGIERPRREVLATPATLPLHIYTDACDSQNAFYPSGWMGALADYGENDSTYSDYKKIIDVGCTDSPYSGETCIRISSAWIPYGHWGGIYWQFPINNWGMYPGYDLSDSVDKDANVILRFHGRGESGGEIAEFISGGIQGLEYEDSYGPIGSDHYLSFRKYWQQYEINLTGLDLSMIVGAFAWVSPVMNPYLKDTFYLDDIVILKVPESGICKQGDICGEIWTASDSPYRVIGDINVLALNIEPGVTVLFMGNYKFEISGGLKAIGTAQDSIYFTKPDSIQKWQGLSGTGSLGLRYCVITGSSNSGIRKSGGWAYAAHCLIAGNSGPRGGGIDGEGMGSLIIDSCDIVNNNATGINALGGGIYVDADSIRITDCRICGNMVMVEKHDSRAGGGGIYANGHTEISRCTISENSISFDVNPSLSNDTAFIAGGGVFAQGNLTISGSEIRGNNLEISTYQSESDSAWMFCKGAGIYATGDSIHIENCILSGNDFTPSEDDTTSRKVGGLYLVSPSASIENCTIADNNCGGVCGAGGDIKTLNSIIWNNGLYQLSGNIIATYSDIDGVYPGEGNINRDPMFIDSQQLRISDLSPCIDAGHFDKRYNDSCQPPALGCLRNDMGAHGGPGSCMWGGTHVYQDTGACLTLKPYVLRQNYPNPFNSSTTIRYFLPKPGHVTLIVYNILGQRVSTLADADMPPGEHMVEWNATNFTGDEVASGVYFYRLNTEEYSRSRLMIFLK